MTDRQSDATLGDTLAETAALNSPERRAGLDAAASVRRVAGNRDRQRANRRRLGWALAALVLSIASLAGLLAIFEG